MSPNPTALSLSREFSVPYNTVRAALNRLVNIAEWTPARAALYARQVLAVGNDLTEAVGVVVDETIQEKVRHA